MNIKQLKNLRDFLAGFEDCQDNGATVAPLLAAVREEIEVYDKHACFQFGGRNTLTGGGNCVPMTPAFIQVDQELRTKRKTFTVTYGLHQKTGLGYAMAARELGECLFHFLSCEGKIDNEGTA